jgi:energy-coupling factor transport system ATP-binding protein
MLSFQRKNNEISSALTDHRYCLHLVLSIMIGFTRPDAGQIRWKGEKIPRGKLKSKISMVMQRPSDFFFGKTVIEELVLGRTEATPNDVRDVLAEVGLNDISLLANPRNLSGGQMKRLAVASQLMRRPRSELMLMDEPMAGVDPTARREMAGLLGELKKDFAIVIVSHEPGELLEYADRVVQISGGRLREVDPAVIEAARRIRQARSIGA